MSSPLLAVLNTREEWLEARRSGIGASDVAAILGVDPRRGALAVYADKVGAAQPSDETPLMRRGRRLEAVIAAEYAEETGRQVRHLGDYTITRHPKLPFFFSTLDRVTEAPERSGRGPLELKSLHAWAPTLAEWETEPPVVFQVQLHAQIACTGATWGSLACLVGGLDLKWTDAERNDRFVAAMEQAVEDFWDRVEKRDPPPPDASAGTLRAIRSLFPKDKGTTIPLGLEWLKAAVELDILKEEIAVREEQKAALEARVKVALADNTWGVLPDGSRFQWRIEHRDGYTVPPCDPRVLRRVARPKVAGKGRSRR